MKLRIKKTILLSFICLLFANSLFAQEDPHDRMVKRMKENGLTDIEIEKEIKETDAFYKKHLDEELQRIQNEIKESRKTNQAQRATQAQRAACTDIPTSEKAVLRAIYDNLNGAAWATGWDFTQPVTSWNPADGTGWFGIVVNDCHVEQFTVNNINVQGDFPNVTELTHLKNLFIGHSMYGHSLPYYITGDFSSIGNLPLLNSLYLTNADFQGEIPLTFNNLDVNFWGLTLAHCNLSENSQLCSIISNFSNLNHLDLSHNFFSGVLPNCFSGGNFTALKTIMMGSNNFSDISVIETHSNLQTLWFENNLIQGDFPDLSNNVNLSNTILELNQIEGQIPNNFPSNIYVLRLSHNKLEGNIPLINYYPGINYHRFDVRNNKYKFKDFEDSFNHYQTNFTDFFYSNQAKTDTVINETVNQGSSYTMTMHTDGNDSSVEQYQWYKGGTEIVGATQRQFTINPVTQSDSGSYYCVSTHPTITVPSDSNKNLILVREPINLTVSNNCPPLEGKIYLADSYQCGTSYFTTFGISYYHRAIANPGDTSNSTPFDTSNEPTAYRAGVSYSWTVTNPAGNIVFNSGISNPSFTFTELGTYIINYNITYSNGCSYQFSKTVEITSCESCTLTNPNTPVVKQLFINLINHLKTLEEDNVPNGYTCPQLTLLAPYVQPFSTVAIYNFTNSGKFVSFSFVDNGTEARADIQIPYTAAENTITDISLNNYSDFSTSFNVNTHKSNGTVDTNNGYIKNIEFCPDELFCENHIAIVVDESGSIDEREARKIRAQLKSFIEQQVVVNETTGTNTHVSLIGLSDSDTYTRTDEVMGDMPLTNANKNCYLTFIDNYRANITNRKDCTNRPIPERGISPNSDYWQSGLTKALAGNPELVVLITDGCQTSNAGALKEFIGNSFNNNGGASSNPKAPHLYVVGLDNGFYVDSDTALNRSSTITTTEDPNLNPSLQRSAGENSRVTSTLRTSLKYLMSYSGTEFPVNDKKYFIYTDPLHQMVDYYAAPDFDFLTDEPNYIFNGSVNAEISCGDEIDIKQCDNCLNFKPTPGKEYIVSAWVKEESKVQVKNYTSGEIRINFLGSENVFINEIIALTSGDIIDDWQRIFKRFKIPSNTHHIEIALVNNSGSVPVYFDDVRIHPVDGSMKSFVYDPETFKLMSELDENNFSTFYEYDNEGGLIRVKKETSRGVKTIQETRSGNVIKVE
jgi:hypothetical protein